MRTSIIILYSYTAARKAARQLINNGMKVSITKISGYKGGGCTYGVRVNGDIEKAEEILRRAGISYRDII